MRQYELNLLISKNSYCTVSIGGCQYCGEEISERVYSQTGFKSAMPRTICRCDHCDKIYRAQVQKDWEYSRMNDHDRMVELLDDKKNKDQWKKLNPEELHVFKQILHFKK